jgi:hypothetical protein
VFSIVINLGADENGKQIVETYHKPLKIGVNDADPCIDIGSEQLATASTPVIANKTPMEIAFDALMERGD